MKYLWKKIGTLIITLFIVSFLSFLAFSVIPGDAAQSKLGTEATEEQVKALQLDDVILFLGKQKNPYPYYRLADAVLLSSKYEGYPVVFVEAMTLNKPIVTTAVSDYREIENKYGIVVENNASAIYRGMKQFLDHGFVIQKPFDPQEFNQQMKEIFENLVEGKK